MATTKHRIMVTDHSHLTNPHSGSDFLVLFLYNITFVLKQFNSMDTKWYKNTSVHRLPKSSTIYPGLIIGYHV